MPRRPRPSWMQSIDRWREALQAASDTPHPTLDPLRADRRFLGSEPEPLDAPPAAGLALEDHRLTIALARQLRRPRRRVEHVLAHSRWHAVEVVRPGLHGVEDVARHLLVLHPVTGQPAGCWRIPGSQTPRWLPPDERRWALVAVHEQEAVFAPPRLDLVTLVRYPAPRPWYHPLNEADWDRLDRRFLFAAPTASEFAARAQRTPPRAWGQRPR